MVDTSKNKLIESYISKSVKESGRGVLSWLVRMLWSGGLMEVLVERVEILSSCTATLDFLPPSFSEHIKREPMKAFSHPGHAERLAESRDWLDSLKYVSPVIREKITLELCKGYSICLSGEPLKKFDVKLCTKSFSFFFNQSWPKANVLCVCVCSLLRCTSVQPMSNYFTISYKLLYAVKSVSIGSQKWKWI